MKIYSQNSTGRRRINKVFGERIIYMNPNISAEYIDKIKIAFGIDSEPVIRYNHSEHYKCHIDR